MPTLVSSGSTTITPSLVLVVAVEREARNIIHPILGRANPDVTLRVSNLRTGYIEMGFSGAAAEADSLAALNLHSGGSVLTLTSTDRTSVQMTYVVPEGGRVSRDLDEATRNDWIVRVEYQEVTP